MSAQLAILGWGSLLWDDHPEFNRHHGDWKCDGPEIELEFSRVSQRRRGALTLVIDEKNGCRCRVAYTLSNQRDPEDAICDLRSREGTTRANIGYFVADGSGHQASNSRSLEAISAWTKAKRLDVVVWTDLKSNFERVCGTPFSVNAAVAHIQALDTHAKSQAAEYVWRAPKFVDTKLRRALQAQPWFAM